MSVTAIANAESDSLIAPPNFIERAANRIIQELSADAEDWAKIAGQVGLFPWTHFVENPKPEDLHKHKATLERLIAFGELLNSAMSSSTFPDKEVAGGVAATLRMLKDDLTERHDELCPHQVGQVVPFTV
jgi:hypothetical protein